MNWDGKEPPIRIQNNGALAERSAMIDCLLAYPIPTQDSPTKHPALSIFCPGAMLEQHGLKVEYFDARFDSFDKFVALVRENPLCVGVSSMTGYQLVGSKRMFEAVKKINPRIHTIFGGVHPSILPEQSLKEETIDFAVVGEGERTLLELVTAIKKNDDLNKINGIYWKNNGKIIANEPREFMKPSEWPFPMTEKNKKYFKAAADSNDMTLFYSRGCPYNCSFCYNLTFNRRKCRAMSADQFKAFIEKLMKEVKFDFLQLCDDEIGFDKKTAKAIAKVLHEFSLTWKTSIRCDNMDEDLVKVFYENGCNELLLGVESGSNRILKEVLKKGYPNGIEDAYQCARILGKTNIHTRYNFMCGVPTETMKEIHASLDSADRIHKIDKNALIGFDAYTPYPGTELYKQALEMNFEEPQTLEGWSKMSLSNATLPIAQKLYYLAGLRFRKDKTSRNFPGLKRLLILPFEIAGSLRWRTRFFAFWGLERAAVTRLFAWASGKVTTMKILK